MNSSSNSTSTDIEDSQNLTFSGLLLLVLFYFSLIIISLIIHQFTWLSAKEILVLPERISANIFQIFKEFYLTVILPSDDDYLLKYIGIEGVCYIHFMRKMCFLTFFMFCIILITILPYSLAQSSFDIWNAFHLDDVYYRFFFQFFYIIVLTILVCCFLFRLKLTLRKIYLTNKAKETEMGFLKLRTIKIKGLDPNDVEGNLIREKIDQVVPDSILSIMPIYNKRQLLKLQTNLIDLKLKKSLQTRENTCCLPQRLSLKEYYIAQIEKVTIQINEQKSELSKFSQHAYILLDSINSANKVLSKFTMFKIGFWKNSCSNCCPPTEGSDEENLLEKRSENPQNHLIASRCIDPIDIFWINMGKSHNLSILWRALINVVGTILILFISTPAAIFSLLGLEKVLQLIKFEEAPAPGSFSNLLEKNIAPLLILTINQLLLLMIDKMAQWKMYSRTSSIQISIYYYCLVYLIFNTFIVPSFSLTAAESVFSFLSKNGKTQNIEKLVQTLYVGATGQLFVILIIQSTCFSFIGDFLRFPELFGSFFNLRLANLRRMQSLIGNKWLKDEDSLFQYGYYYGKNIAFITIIFTFCSLVPTVSLFGSIYFGVKLFCDWYNMLIMHRKEMNSHGKLAEKAIYATSIALLFSQMVLAIFYLISQLYVNAILTFIIIMFSGLFIFVKLNFPICDDRDDGMIIRHSENIEEWKKMYSSPSLDNDFDEIDFDHLNINEN